VVVQSLIDAQADLSLTDARYLLDCNIDIFMFFPFHLAIPGFLAAFAAPFWGHFA
jgi:hypothetical protein